MDRSSDTIERGAATLIAGKPLIFPTDTVYGLGVAVGIAEDPRVLYDIKGRDHGKPVAWLVGTPESLHLYGSEVSESALALARTYWPGPLTIIVKADSSVRAAFRAENGTIALRMPDNALALELIAQVGVPIATTSANISGQAPPKHFEEIDQRVLAQVSCALRDDSERIGLASTIVDCTAHDLAVIREGSITRAEIASFGL